MNPASPLKNTWAQAISCRPASRVPTSPLSVSEAASSPRSRRGVSARSSAQVFRFTSAARSSCGRDGHLERVLGAPVPVISLRYPVGLPDLAGKCERGETQLKPMRNHTLMQAIARAEILVVSHHRCGLPRVPSSRSLRSEWADPATPLGHDETHGHTPKTNGQFENLKKLKGGHASHSTKTT